jgi:hypothetical protein
MQKKLIFSKKEIEFLGWLAFPKALEEEKRGGGECVRQKKIDCHHARHEVVVMID